MSQEVRTFNISQPCDLAIDKGKGFLFVSTKDGHIIKLKDFKKIVKSWTFPITTNDGEAHCSVPHVFALSPSNIFVLSVESREIFKFDLNLENRKIIKCNGIHSYPFGMSLDKDGVIYISVLSESKIFKMGQKDEFVPFVDMKKNRPLFFFELPLPSLLKISNDGFFYVLDAGGNRVLKYGKNGKFVSAWGGQGLKNGQFDDPNGLAIDLKGNVYVADSKNNRIEVFSENGNFISKIDRVENLNFSYPAGLTTDENGFLYVADLGNNRIVRMKCP